MYTGRQLGRVRATPRRYTGSYARSGLGLLPSLAIPTFLTSLNGALAVLGLNSSDPVRDQARLARIATAFSLAVAGDTTPQSGLDGLSGEAYLHEIATNAPVAGGGTAGGSTVAVTAAKAALVELQARRAATGVIGAALPLSTIPATAAHLVTTVAMSPVVWAGIAVAAFLLFKGRGKK